MENNIEIRPLTHKDWSSVSNIYKLGIATGHATFETEVPPWNKWDENHMPSCRIVAEINGLIVGWAALTPVSDRCIYAGVAEVSVYVHPDAGRKGIGTSLLSNLIDLSEKEGIWTLKAGIFPENISSIKLHEKLGFNLLGVQNKIGKMDNWWRDVALYERRSRIIGID